MRPGPALGPCAKLEVVCHIVSADERRIFVGTNEVRRPQQACPRQGASYAREDYRLCRDVCAQPAHAEIVALRAAGMWAKGATAYVSHHRICTDCAEALHRAGVAKVVKGANL